MRGSPIAAEVPVPVLTGHALTGEGSARTTELFEDERSLCTPWEVCDGGRASVPNLVATEQGFEPRPKALKSVDRLLAGGELHAGYASAVRPQRTRSVGIEAEDVSPASPP